MNIWLTRALCVATLVGGGLTATAPAAAQGPTAAVSQSDSTRPPDAYRIGPEDMLQISVWKNDAMSKIVPVRPDGKISLPLLNDVQAAGLTALELREALTQKLVEFIPSPEVSVIVLEVRSLKVSVIGEVMRPGRFELKSYATVLDVLSMAGGFTQFASRSGIVVHRQDGATMKKIRFNYNKLSGDQENFYLRNGDVIVVP